MRFMSNNMLTIEESQHKNEIIEVTEQVLDAKGLECDERISKLSEEKLGEILEEVRKLRSSKKRKRIDHDLSDDGVVLNDYFLIQFYIGLQANIYTEPKSFIYKVTVRPTGYVFSEANSVEFPASNSGKHNLFYTLVFLPKNY